MKDNFVVTENYLLVVDDSEIKSIDWVYVEKYPEAPWKFMNPPCPMPYWGNKQEAKKIIAHLPLNGAPYLDGVDVLPPLPLNQTKYIKEYQQYPDGTHVCIAYSNGDWFCDCGLEGNVESEKNADLILDKLNNLYTEEHLRKTIDMAREQHLVKYTDNDYEFEHTEDEIIKSIQQPKLPIAFECVDEYVHDDTVPYPKTLGTQPKTITNSDGRREWVGKYIW